MLSQKPREVNVLRMTVVSCTKYSEKSNKRKAEKEPWDSATRTSLYKSSVSRQKPIRVG